jgi:uncharacterized protein DUF397
MTEWRKSSFSGENTNCVEIAWRKSSFSGGNTNCVEIGWRKSTFSDGNTDCVEVASTLDCVGVRDSKNITAPNLAFPRAGWRDFIDSLD